MKNRIILIIVIVLVIVGAVLGYLYFRSFHKVNIAFSPDMSATTIFTEKGEEIKKLSSSGEISLQSGNYYTVPDGQKISKEKITFSIKDDNQTVSIDPDYSAEYLAVSLVNERDTIATTAKAAFPLIAQSYTIEQGTLYHHGEWFGALLTKNGDPRDQPDYYRIALHKENGTWKVIGTPVLVMTKADFKEIPANILKAINQLAQ